MNEKADNSFFHQDCTGLRVLVLAPHPDDEINVAGNMIYSFRQMGAEVFVLYSTNGDFEGLQEVRFREVGKSLAMLGLDDSHYDLLGYGDTYNGTGNPHVYYAEEAMTSPAGHRETYGAAGREEYHFCRHGEHGAYTRQNFLSDLHEYIMDKRADIIFCVDYDLHADHRALSLAFETVMGEILRERDNTYFPVIYKRFAYSTAFTAAQDFSELNLQEIKRPVPGEIESYDYDLIDKSVYLWDRRVRFPVHAALREKLLSQNIIARAILAHKSQHNEKNSYSLINSDEIFWQRRTDNLSYQAEIKASSGDTGCLAEFLLLDPVDLDAHMPAWQDKIWKPEQGDTDRTISYTWDKPQSLRRICLYGSVNVVADAGMVKITFDDGESILAGPLKAYGAPLIVELAKSDVRRLTVQLLEATAAGSGIAYCEFFAEAEQKLPFSPYIKILVDDNFAYRYGGEKHRSVISLSCYRYGALPQTISYRVLAGNAFIDGDGNLVWKDDEPVTVGAFAGNDETVFDKVEFYRIGMADKLGNHIRNLMNRLYLLRERRK